MDFQTINAMLPLINLLGTAAIGVYLRIEKRNDKTNERIDALNGAVERLNREVARVECGAAAAPSHADLAKVYASINTLSATVNQLVGEFRASGDTLRLILNKITQGDA